jgi:UDP-3-O-[3-hydroxymyristoyl] glucosamine N-acyltransferase
VTERLPNPLVSLGELAQRAGGAVEGDPETVIGSVTGVEDAASDSLVRVDNPRYLAAAVAGPGRALIIGSDAPSPGKPALRVRNPKLAFAICLEALAPAQSRPAPGIHPSAVIGEGVLLGEGVAVMAGVVIGSGTSIGADTVLYPNVTVGERVTVGPDCILFPHVCVYGSVEIGARVRIHAGAVIGADGFGYVWDGAKHQKIPHVGSVRIGDDVEIGANCAIDRATTGMTEIGAGTKIDNLVQIGHNVCVGAHCLIVAQAGLAGSCTLGQGVVLGGQSAVRDHVRVGDGSQVAGKSGIWTDLPAGGMFSGNPARRHFEEERSIVAVRRAPELLRRMRAVELELQQLRRDLERMGSVGEEDRAPGLGEEN